MNEDQLLKAKIHQHVAANFFDIIQNSTEDIERYSGDQDVRNFYMNQVETYQMLSWIHYRKARVAMGIEDENS